MKKLIVNFGLENISIIKVEVKQKSILILNKATLDSSKFYTESGSVDIKKAVAEIKMKLGKEAETLDMSVILPDYMTKTSYMNSADLKGVKPADIKEPYNSKLSDKQVVFIADNGTTSISQVIFYNKKILKSFIKEMYKGKLNVTEAISNYSAIQNCLPAINAEDESYAAMSKTRIFILMGATAIDCIVMMGNLPVYIKESGYSLFDMFTNMKEQYPAMTFSSFMNAYRESTPYEADQKETEHIINGELSQREIIEFGDMFNEDMYNAPDKGQEADHSNVNSDDKSKYRKAVSKELKIIMEMVSKDVREVIDYINDQYGVQSIEICTNSATAQSFMCSLLSEVYSIKESVEISEKIGVGNIVIDTSRVDKFGIDILPCIGSIICGLKKGVEFYA